MLNAAIKAARKNMTHDLNVPYVRDENKKFSQKYADRLEEHPNALAIDLMSEADILRGLKRKQPRDLYMPGHILFKTFTNCQTYY